MSNNKKNSRQTNNILVSSKDVENFRDMLANFGKEITILNTNYQKLLDCNYK